MCIRDSAKTWILHKSTINVDTLLITLYETYEPVCMKQNLELKLHLSEESYPAMFTDKDRLFQILCVFMDNAIQHSKNNSLIEIEVIATEKNIAFSVVDHGQGISDEDKQYIFDRFYSGDKSHTNKSNFGLGLSIAKELTQMLNGIITVSYTHLSLRGSLAFFWKGHGVQSPWLAISQTYLCRSLGRSERPLSRGP